MRPERNRIYIARNPATGCRVLDGELIILSPRDSTLFTLSPVGTEIWEAADGQTPLSDIVEKRICGRFDVDPATAYQSSEEFVRALAETGVLRISETPIAPRADFEYRPPSRWP